MGLLVGASFIVRIERIEVLRDCALAVLEVPEFTGAGNFVVTVTTAMGTGFVTEDVTIRIGSAATNGTAKRRVQTLKITRPGGLNRGCNNWELAVASGRLVRAVIWCFMRNSNVMGMTLTCASSRNANKSCFSA